VVAYVVEIDGTVQHAKVIQSSGHRVLDLAERTFWMQVKYDSPGQLDGAPVRVLVESTMNFKLAAPAIALPASFSDTVIAGFGDQILQRYERSDADALYRDLDETVKATTSPNDIQKQFERYSKRFGALEHFQYLGLFRAKNVDGVLHYEMNYLVQCTNPTSGAATMIVTAVDRQPQPKIMSFEVKANNEVRLK
jgi:hypothetical protein